VRDDRLIDSDNKKSCLIQPADGFGGGGNELHSLRIGEMRDLLVDHALAVEKCRWPYETSSEARGVAGVEVGTSPGETSGVRNPCRETIAAHQQQDGNAARRRECQDRCPLFSSSQPRACRPNHVAGTISDHPLRRKKLLQTPSGYDPQRCDYRQHIAVELSEELKRAVHKPNHFAPRVPSIAGENGNELISSEKFHTPKAPFRIL
jgi:hypothetical protein